MHVHCGYAKFKIITISCEVNHEKVLGELLLEI